MNARRLVFNPPPGWPKPPDGWTPPKGWSPDPSWPDPPSEWQLWIPGDLTEDETQSGAGDPESENLPPVTEAATAQAGQPESVSQRIAILEAENKALRAMVDDASTVSDVIILDDERILQEIGIYRYHHPLENASEYRDRLDELGSRIANLIKTSGAIEMSNTFTFDNSLAKGQRMTKDLAKLMLRAYNAEVDNSIRSLRAGNIVIAKRRVEASRAAIKKLGTIMQMQISDAFHALRIDEIELTSDYLMKKKEEREAASEERARLREERKVEAELEQERERLNKERDHLSNAIEALRASGSEAAELESKLAEVDEAIAQNDFRAANVRAGYIYVISNHGAFGQDVVKIGLTRRLEPLDRVRELGDASVPFRFDVHSIFFSEDAVTLEAELHKYFADRRLNHANLRREFFFASPVEVREVLISKVGGLLEFTEHAESTEYLQSVHYWPEQYKKAR